MIFCPNSCELMDSLAVTTLPSAVPPGPVYVAPQASMGLCLSSGDGSPLARQHICTSDRRDRRLIVVLATPERAETASIVTAPVPAMRSRSTVARNTFSSVALLPRLCDVRTGHGVHLLDGRRPPGRPPRFRTNVRDDHGTDKRYGERRVIV